MTRKGKRLVEQLLGLPRLVLGLGVAAVALNGGTLVALAIADPSVGRAFGAAMSLALLLAWLFLPAPVGEDAALGWLLSPEPSRPLWAAIILGLGWALLALAGAHIVVALGSFDLDARGWRPASGWEIAWNALTGLLAALFHGLFCLGWAMGRRMREGRDLTGVPQAVALAAALPFVVLAPFGYALLGMLLGLMLVAPATLLMSLAVLLGGRVWPVILANAAAMAVACFSIEVALYGEVEAPG